jgi:hypothetical protein
MYHQESLQILADIQKTTIDQILNKYKGSILYIAIQEDENKGHVIKDMKGSDIKVLDVINTRNPDIIQVGKNRIGIVTELLNTTRIIVPKPKKKETKKELNGKNILTAVKMITQLFEIDPESTMEQLKFMNEKIRMRNKLIEKGYETKEQRKYVHDALKYCAKNIKSKGSEGAAEDTAEKYRIETKLIKHLRGFQSRLFVNPFK